MLGLLFSLFSFSQFTQGNQFIESLITHSLALENVGAHEGITPLLNGVDLFLQANFTGVGAASLAGGTEIMFSGQGLSHSAEDVTVMFSNSQYNFLNAGPAMSSKQSFNDFIYPTHPP